MSIMGSKTLDGTTSNPGHVMMSQTYRSASEHIIDIKYVNFQGIYVTVPNKNKLNNYFQNNNHHNGTRQV